MLRVEDMPLEEMKALLGRIGYGHLGCAREGRPYVVPMNYAYDGEALYVFTTEGMKTSFMEANPEVCLQVEEVESPRRWQSVMVTGRAERLTSQEEKESAMQLITRTNPTLTPAINRTQLDAWGRANEVALYRIRPAIIDGRRTAD
ncbi:MAG TPA: pyridoxamine 5'-phosphate oxidase family protein [Pyrinomonadaceae bacterium]|jgi:nitroimidazol reductase NimA-like FMN-containing flavoprotein (pyridoxamine 5'-phosphate oxidase superfamily)